MRRVMVKGKSNTKMIICGSHNTYIVPPAGQGYIDGEFRESDEP